MGFDEYALKIANKNTLAFERLYEKLNKLVFSVSFSVLKDRFLAEDITQETFNTVWERSDEFRGIGYKTWILTIAKNKSLNLLKKRSRDSVVDFNENANMYGEYTINDQVEKNNMFDIIARVLTYEEREIVLLKNSGMKMKEIAEILNEPRGTISWRYSQSIEKLKKVLKGN